MRWVALAFVSVLGLADLCAGVSLLDNEGREECFSSVIGYAATIIGASTLLGCYDFLKLLFK